ncbi:hypothetical protein RJ639_044544, partial [Escallonia herrerae]
MDKGTDKWFCDGEESDELRSLEGSESIDGDRPRYPKFNAKTDYIWGQSLSAIEKDGNDDMFPIIIDLGLGGIEGEEYNLEASERRGKSVGEVEGGKDDEAEIPVGRYEGVVEQEGEGLCHPTKNCGHENS